MMRLLRHTGSRQRLGPGEPSGSNLNDEDCAVLGDFVAAGMWYDVRCRNEYYVVCEIEM